MNNLTIKTIILTVFLLSNITFGFAQNSYRGNFTFENFQSSLEDGQLTIHGKLVFDKVTLHSQRMVVFTPEIRLPDQSKSQTFAPIVIVGKTRDKALDRAIGFDHFDFKETPQHYIIRKNNHDQSTLVSFSTPFAEWMRDAELVFNEEVSGCAECDLGMAERKIKDRLLPPVFTPEYAVIYVTPETEPVKQRSETYAAHLNYRVARYELLRDFQNNGRVLDEVDRIIHEIRTDKNLTIQSLTVTGYASPEGNYNSNMELSKNRAYSFVNYLVRSHGLQESMMKTDWKGEDWDGLRKVVDASYLADKEAIIRIIDSNYDIAKRKQSLHALNGGATYRMLLNEYYPPLRRNEYTIAYVARAFNIEEAKELIKTKPQHLSLNEMFLVANTYPKDSPEFKEIFDIAVRLYPDDDVAKLNAAAQDIEAGIYNRAIERLSGINLIEAWNNLGVIYAQMGDFTQAGSYFKRAADRGNAVARSNKEQLEKFLKEN